MQGPSPRNTYSIGINKVATINDKKTYGEGLVKAFEAEFTKGGGTLVASETINADDTTRTTSVIASVKPKGAQAVYYGGEYPQAGPLSQQMKTNGLNIPLMGGDGIFDPKVHRTRGHRLDRRLGYLGGRAHRKHRGGQGLPRGLHRRRIQDPAGAYGGYS